MWIVSLGKVGQKEVFLLTETQLYTEAHVSGVGMERCQQLGALDASLIGGAAETPVSVGQVPQQQMGCGLSSAEAVSVA